jgi:NAD(P)-dependent dehydrogenase (short-subunit alcohol dehydrogenase family)
MNELRGKTAVVSAAASGVGKALASALAAEGMNVALLDIRGDAVDEVCAEIPAGGGAVRSYQVDVGERDSVYRAAGAVERDFGDVHLLCSNAGVIFTGTPLDETPDEMFDWMMNVNVTGTFNMIRAFVPRMRAHRAGGHVTITSSAAGLHILPGENFGAYAAAKMAVVGLGEDLRDTLASEGIGVSVLCLGRIATSAATSGMQRPARYGGPFKPETFPAEVNAMAPADAARIIIRGIRDDAPYIFTRLSDRADVARRFRAINADFDRWDRTLPELGL